MKLRTKWPRNSIFEGLTSRDLKIALVPGFCALATNVRAYLKGGFALRNPLSIALFASLPAPIHTIRRLNDSTPNGPASGYTLIVGAGTSLYAWNSTIGS